MKKISSFTNLLSAIFLFNTPLYVSTAVAEEDNPSALLDGQTLFHDNCSVCHGDRGDGNSRAKGSFVPAPRNFTDSAEIKDLTRSRMIFSVTYGRPNTAMAPWANRLTTRDIATVVDYIRKDFMKINVEKEKLEIAQAEDKMIKGDELDPKFLVQPLPYDLEGKVVWGKLFYEETCADCHGVNGDGNGPRSYFILPRPRDYRHPASRHKYNLPTLFDAIAKGSHGSEMPAWDKVLTHQEIGHVSEYIFQAFIKPIPER